MRHLPPSFVLLLAAVLGCSGEADTETAAEPVAVSSGAEADDPMADDPMADDPMADDATADPASASTDECRDGAEVAAIAEGDPIPAPPDVAAPPADAEVTASGLASKRLIPGCGLEHPTAASQVTVHYTGWTTDGAMFDSSVTRGREATFPLSRVIAGWTEGVQLMTAGEKRRFWIPADLAYGTNPRPGAPAGMLVFDVDLIAIEQ